MNQSFIMGSVLRAMRELSGIPQGYIAELLSVGQSTVSKKERGESLLFEEVASMAAASGFLPSDTWAPYEMSSRVISLFESSGGGYAPMDPRWCREVAMLSLLHYRADRKTYICKEGPYALTSFSWIERGGDKRERWGYPVLFGYTPANKSQTDQLQAAPYPKESGAPKRKGSVLVRGFGIVPTVISFETDRWYCMDSVGRKIIPVEDEDIKETAYVQI